MRSALPILACAGAAAARSFRDTSPFVFFTTHKALPSFPSIASADSLAHSVTAELTECRSDVYILAHQDGISADDLAGDDSTLGLQSKWLSGHERRVAGQISVAQVVGDELYADADADGNGEGYRVDRSGLDRVLIGRDDRHHHHRRRFHATLEAACGAAVTVVDPHSAAVVAMTDAANVTKPRIVSVDLPAIPAGAESAHNAEERRRAWRQHEQALNRIIELYTAASPDRFTVLLTTSPPVFDDSDESVVNTGASSVDKEEDDDDYVAYSMEDMQDPLANVELKRGLMQQDGLTARAAKNGTSTNLPLFEQYQYFTPGIFMGLIVFIALGLILYVAISAVSSLTVSYAAFEKDSGPGAHKKQQ